MARTVRQYINEFDPEWDVRGVGEWRGSPVIWMVRSGSANAPYSSPPNHTGDSSRHYISRFDGTVILEEEWAETEERARMAFDAMRGA